MVPSSSRGLRALSAFVLRCAAFAAAAAVASTSAPAFAQQKDPYKQHMEVGVTLFQSGNYPGAITEFRAAYDAKPKASPLLNLALCYKALFNYPKAIQYLDKALKQHEGTMDASDKRAAEQAIQEMTALLGYVNVRVTPPEAILTVDGEDVGANVAGTPVPLGPGKHRVGAHSEGFDPQELEVTVVSGERDKVLTLQLVPNRTWVVITYPGNILALDGTPLGKDAFSGMLPPGQHHLQIYTPGRPGFDVPLTLLAGQSVVVEKGPRGVPTVRGAAPTVPIVQAVPVTTGPPPVLMPPPPLKKIEEPAPQYRGFYLLAGADLMWELSHESLVATNGQNGVAKGTPLDFSTNSGFGAQLVAGYRINNFAGFELLFEYDNIFTPLSTNADHGYTQSDVRLGPGLRLMTNGHNLRFIGTVAGGYAHESVSFNLPEAGLTGDSASSGINSAFALGEIGMELEFSGLIVDAVEAARRADDASAHRRLDRLERGRARRASAASACASATRSWKAPPVTPVTPVTPPAPPANK